MNTNNYEVILTDMANEELEAIYEYISCDLCNELAAKRLMEKIENGFLNLEQSPYLGREVHIKLQNEVYRKLVIENYIALYDVDEQYKQVVIYRVINSRRDYLKVIE